jgi:tetratricopeptide (TPR) repeat protein
LAFVRTKAGDDAYRDNMLAAIGMMDSASAEQALLEAANYFIRISSLNPDEWLPHYYAAYCYTRISHLNHEKDICDKWVDRAQYEADIAYTMSPENAEVLVMKGFVLQARMNINPMVRGFKYFDETMGYFSKASIIDPENPRAYLWKGVNLLHTPEAFGGGKKSGCPLIREAIAKYEAVVTQDPIDPAWGYSYAKEMLNSCQ